MALEIAVEGRYRSSVVQTVRGKNKNNCQIFYSNQRSPLHISTRTTGFARIPLNPVLYNAKSCF